jgi:hypothetical protein
VLSVVVGADAPEASLSACLEALEPQREDAEVIVCTPRALSSQLVERFAWARVIERSDALVPVLWSAGIAASSGDAVALTIAQMVPASDWVGTLHRHLGACDAVAGAIEPGGGLRLADWAEYFCRYAPDMLPFEARESADLPGDNAGYRREALELAADLYREGFWEPVVHRRLADGGAALWHVPDLVVRQGRSNGVRAFVRQRLRHGRAHGSQRGELFSRGRNLAGVLAAPAVPLVLAWRLARRVLAIRRHRLRALAALPLILVFDGAWAVGEARGHLGALRR